MVEEPVLRPAQPADFTFCERTYFAGMAAIIETLRLDMARQRDSGGGLRPIRRRRRRARYGDRRNGTRR